MSPQTARKQGPRLRAVAGGGGTETFVTDEQIVEAVQRGDDRMAALLYERLADVVDQTLYRVFGRREGDHDDLVQMAFEQIVITLAKRSFAGACSLRTWASTVTANVGLTALRQRARERKVVAHEVILSEEDGDRVPSADTERMLDARSRLNRLRAHLVKMKAPYAETVFLHDALGHELAEIAVMTGVSVSAAQSRLVRGRRELRRRLEKDPLWEGRSVP